MDAQTLQRDDSRPHQSDTATQGGYRADVEGMRAIAVLMVMLFHAGIPLFTGGFIGVDVFFVISGFLITGLILREIERNGRVTYLLFYARRTKRLLPAATLVLVLVALASWLWQPAGLWSEVSVEIAAATFFVANWVFASKATDYFAADGAESPVQHFWSLSVEEQFYLFWPTLLVVFAGLALLRALSIRRRLLVGMLLVFVPSLAYSWYLTDTEASRAYFVTTTRVWELALGGIVVLTMHQWRKLPREVLFCLAWLGLAMVIASGLLYTTSTPFPGLFALVPTMGAALMIGAYTSTSGSLKTFLSRSPLVWIGGISYSLYLWHWPLAVMAPYVFPDSGPWIVAAAVAVSVVPAWLSYRLIEHPIHHSKVLAKSNGGMLAMGLLCLCLATLAAIQLNNAGQQSRATAFSSSGLASSDGLAAGAAAIYGRDPSSADSLNYVGQGLVPDPAWVKEDLGVPRPEQCEGGGNSNQLKICSAGDPDNPIRVVLVGDSHAMHWFPALEESADTGAFQVQLIAKSSCPWADEMIWHGKDGREFTECAEWREAVLTFILQDPPQIVLATAWDRAKVAREGRPLPYEQSGPAIAAGMARLYDQLAKAGIAVIHVADTPDMNALAKLPDCVLNHQDDLATCEVPEQDAIPPQGASKELPGILPEKIKLINMNDGLCLANSCPSVIGNVLVYRDRTHLTGTYSRTLAPYLLERIKASVPTLFRE